jgi:2-phospho-L-lactate guanylyltransferase
LPGARAPAGRFPGAPAAGPSDLECTGRGAAGIGGQNAGVSSVSSARPDPGWLVLLPVKSTTRGKSRILLEPRHRARVALAMALDTAAAAAAASRVAEVLALVDDDADGRALAGIPGVRAHRVRARGLNESIREACLLPVSADRPVAVLPADLPSLRPVELDAALDAAAGLAMAVVADRQGTGTTLLAAQRPALLDPHYGVGSFAAHVAAGAVPLAVPGDSGLRRDVDVLDDLRDATGPLTSAEAATTGNGAAAG